MALIRFNFLAFAAMIALFSVPAGAYELEGAPGSMWGFLGYDNDDFSGSAVQGFVNQGIQLVTLPGDIKVVSYAEYRHRSRNKNQDYFDAGGPAVGLELRKGFFNVGVDYYWQRLPVLGVSSNRAQAYVGWFITWDANPEKKLGSLDLPGSSWGLLGYDNDDYSGSGVQGFINQGVTLYKFPGDIPMIAYAEYRHRSRNLNQKYYDSGGPAVGLEFRKSVVSWGVDYYWERLPVLGESSNRAQLYITWYVDWDLFKLK
ncbi:MAG: hypothetical protein HZB29_01110 [Nitrospinae bacterium]|nr:hypothetical protein [Nitrospinota bacterium]